MTATFVTAAKIKQTETLSFLMYMYGVSSASSLARVLKNVSRHRDEQKQTTAVKMSLFPDESHHRPKGNV